MTCTFGLGRTISLKTSVSSRYTSAVAEGVARRLEPTMSTDILDLVEEAEVIDAVGVRHGAVKMEDEPRSQRFERVLGRCPP